MPKPISPDGKVPSAKPYFSEEGLKFLRGLKRNNRREWFEARKGIYEREVKAPMIALVGAITDSMLEFAPHHVRPPQKSIMRIYRDTRFSADKTPYKSHIAAWWARQGLEKTSGGGYYIHIAPQEVVVAAGIYMPEREQLLAIRTFLLEHHAELRKVLSGRALTRAFTLDHGELLSRPPKGFPREHPAMDLLRCRQWAVIARMPGETALEQRFAKRVVEKFRIAAPLVELLNRPLATEKSKKPAPLFGLY